MGKKRRTEEGMFEDKLAGKLEINLIISIMN